MNQKQKLYRTGSVRFIHIYTWRERIEVIVNPVLPPVPVMETDIFWLVQAPHNPFAMHKQKYAMKKKEEKKEKLISMYKTKKRFLQNGITVLLRIELMEFMILLKKLTLR